MRIVLNIKESDPFGSFEDGVFSWQGNLHFRIGGAVTTIFSPWNIVKPEADVPTGATGVSISGEQLIRLMKISAHIQDPSLVKEI